MVSLALRSISQQLPPLPEGFVLDQAPAKAKAPPPPPPGFVIDAEPQEAPAPDGFRYADDPLSPGGRGLQPIPQKESWADKAKSGVADAVGYMAAPLTENANPAMRVAGEVAKGVGTGVGQWGVTTVTDPIEGANQAVEAFSPMTPFSEGYQATGEAGQALAKGDIGEAAKQAVRAVSGYGDAALSVIPGGGLAKQAGAAPVKVTPREVLGSLAAEALDAPVRPQALDAISRILVNSGVPRDRINAGLGRVVDLLKEPAGRAATVAQLLQREFGEEFPQVVDNVNIAVRERGLSSKPGDASPSIVRDTTQQMRGSQTGFLTDSANRNLGDASRTGTREQMEENLREIGRTGYEPLLEQAVDPERAAQIQRVLNGPGMSELGRPLRQIAAGEGVDLETFIKTEPLRAAHWMQHKARLLADDQAGKNDPLAGAYNSMRNRILSTLDDLKAPDGRTYADLRAEYGDEAAVGQALNAGNRFGTEVLNPQGAEQFVKSFNEMTDPQKQAALISIRDWVQSKLRGAPEDAPARIAELSKLGVLDALEKIGGGAKALADDIRTIRSENEFLGATTNRGQSATMTNAQALKEGPKVYSKGPGSLGTVGTDVVGMLTGAWNGPMNTVLKGGGALFDKLGRPMTSTREDMTRVLMARQKAAQREAEAPPGPTTGLGGPAAPASQPATALGATPEPVAARTTQPERNAAPATALGSIGGGTAGYNAPLDLNGDGEITEEERIASGAIGTALGGVGGKVLGDATSRMGRNVAPGVANDRRLVDRMFSPKPGAASNSLPTAQGAPRAANDMENVPLGPSRAPDMFNDLTLEERMMLERRLGKPQPRKATAGPDGTIAPPDPVIGEYQTPDGAVRLTAKTWVDERGELVMSPDWPTNAFSDLAGALDQRGKEIRRPNQDFGRLRTDGVWAQQNPEAARQMSQDVAQRFVNQAQSGGRPVSILAQLDEFDNEALVRMVQDAAPSTHVVLRRKDGDGIALVEKEWLRQNRDARFPDERWSRFGTGRQYVRYSDR